ncbi:7867_t:CDS:1 [Acaulospora colombiana]|uniref:7867_t:CDS:1 n=1 Tax=Acaulospora colombiana TaxID=27376 RepID=A0ACA9NKI0_9GLOM|nr:7867_t:CDS:1 [Acaulospora colombiana]
MAKITDTKHKTDHTSSPTTSTHPQSTSSTLFNVVKQSSTSNSVTSHTPISSTINTETLTSSQLPSGSSLSSSNGTSDYSKTSSFLLVGIVLVVVALVVIITVICRKCGGEDKKGTIRLKDEPDLPETPKFASLPLENNDSSRNYAVDNNNNNSILVNIVDYDDEIANNNFIGYNTGNSGTDNNVNNFMGDNANIVAGDNVDNNFIYGNAHNDVINDSDEGNDDYSSESRIPSQPPMVQLGRLSSTNLSIDCSPFEDIHNFDSNDNNNGVNRPNSTIIHKLEMEHQQPSDDVSPLNRMTLSDYNDYSNIIQTEPYPSFESQFPNPPKRAFL